MPLDVDALTALRDLTAPRPEQRRALPQVSAIPSVRSLVAVDLPRRRVVVLVLAAAVAGLVCGLLAPGGPALAAPLTSALSGALHPALPDRPDPRPVPAGARSTSASQAVDDAATPDPEPGGRPGVSAVDALTGALRSGLAADG